MIPITDRHLWEACGLAIEQDITELETQPCGHCFSEDFRNAMQQLQEETGKKRTAKFSGPHIRPLQRLLPAAAAAALVCLAGYRLLDSLPFRMGAGESGYSQNSEAGATVGDTGEFAMETDMAEAAKGTTEDWEEPAGEAAAEKDSEAANRSSGISPDEKAMIIEDAEDSMDKGAPQESANGQTGSSAESSTSKKESRESAKLLLLSVAYDAPTQTLELELQNNSSQAIILENSWMLFNADGENVNIEAADPEPFRLAPGKTAVIRGILPDGELPEGEYTLDADNGEHTLTFSFP